MATSTKGAEKKASKNIATKTKPRASKARPTGKTRREVTTITLTLDKELVDAINSLSEASGIPKSVLVSRALGALTDPEKMSRVKKAISVMNSALLPERVVLQD